MRLPVLTSASSNLKPPTLSAVLKWSAFSCSVGFDLVEAEDVTQEVFLNVLKTPERKRPTEYFFRWLLVCAKNLAIDRRRRSKREVLAPAAQWKRWEETMGNAVPDAAFTLQERERFEAVPSGPFKAHGRGAEVRAPPQPGQHFP